MKWLALALTTTLLPSAALAADAANVLECINRVKSASWASPANREVLAAFACRGGGEALPPEATADFEKKAEALGTCFKMVSFQSHAKGLDAEIVAAKACAGSVSAEETVDCLEKVQRVLRHATGAAAESIAADACARGNPADETAECVRSVSFRLEADGVASEILASIACGR